MKWSIGYGLGVCLLALCWFQTSQAITHFEDMCRLFKTGIKIRKPGTCDSYIQCASGHGMEYQCTNGQNFDASSQKCVAATTANKAVCANVCEGLDDMWVSDPTDCANYFYCWNSVAYLGHCENKEHFNETTQSCEYISDSLCVEVANICKLVPSGTKFRREADCSDYYECGKTGSHTLKSCSNQYFDVELGKCMAKDKVECSAHSKKKICVDSKNKPVTGYVSDGATCRGYFSCNYYGSVADVDPIWLQCPEGQFFDKDIQKCAKPSSVVCTFNRCEGRGTMFVTSSKNNCHNYIQCENNVEVAEFTCLWDYFFDEAHQTCTKAMIYDGCCDGRD
ncbi:CG17147 [Drosophila busckii]|uniref:CG17147 n=1 Tax=Drosophila busckii TaxID=30019 RepID=A0A0M4EQ64_DROBS|nr:CG17147 [Drosophila busckii]